MTENIFFDLLQSHIAPPSVPMVVEPETVKMDFAWAMEEAVKAMNKAYLKKLGEPVLKISKNTANPFFGALPAPGLPPEPRVSFARVYLRGRKGFAVDMKIEPDEMIPLKIFFPEDLDAYEGRIGTFVTFNSFQAWKPSRYPEKLTHIQRVFGFDKEVSPGTANHEIYYREV